MYLYICLSYFPFNNFWVDRSVSPKFDKEHQVSNILCSKKLFKGVGLGRRQKRAEGQEGMALLGSPGSQGPWLAGQAPHA